MIKNELATKIIALNLLNIELSLINPSLYKIISKIQTLISAAIELPSAIPTCPRPITKAKKQLKSTFNIKDINATIIGVLVSFLEKKAGVNTFINIKKGSPKENAIKLYDDLITSIFVKAPL